MKIELGNSVEGPIDSLIKDYVWDDVFNSVRQPVAVSVRNLFWGSVWDQDYYFEVDK